MYKGTSEEHEAILQSISSNLSAQSCSLNFIDAVCGQNYRRATWTNVGYIIFHELTGVNVIAIYSTLIFEKMDKSGGQFTPRQGTYLVGILNFLSCYIGVLTVRYFGRRTLCIFGHLFIALVHGLVGYFDITDHNTGILCSIIAF